MYFPKNTTFDAMKTKYLALLFVFFTCLLFVSCQPGFEDKYEAKNQLVNGVKEGKWVEYFDSLQKPSKDSNAPHYKLIQYKAGVPVGIVRTYKKGGILYSETPYKDGKANGIEIQYDEAGNLLGKTPYVNGLKNGMDEEYWENGKILSECPYVDGKKNGVYIGYDRSEEIMEEVTFKNGKENGSYKIYQSNGKLLFEAQYKDGKILDRKDYDIGGNLKGEWIYSDSVTRHVDASGDEIK
jgi:antitoxin component YwqK of YwqJK toxin-antitoxin module